MPNLRSIKTHNVKKSLVITGLVLSAVPLLLMTGWIDRQFTALIQTSRHDSEHQASASLDQQAASWRASPIWLNTAFWTIFGSRKEQLSATAGSFNPEIAMCNGKQAINSQIRPPATNCP